MTSEEALQYKSGLKEDAEKLLLTGFPKTIVALNSLLDSPKFKKTTFQDLHQNIEIIVPRPPLKRRFKDQESLEDGATINKLRILPSGGISSNKHIIEIIAIVKPHMVKLMEDSKLIKMWISLLVPKIEDGNNFGVEIQEDVLTLVRGVEDMGIRFFTTISKYFESRAKIVKSLAKYPHVKDYQQAVRELDEREYMGMCFVLAEVRNSYMLLHDVVTKNLEKIKNPRNNLSSAFLYGAA